MTNKFKNKNFQITFVKYFSICDLKIKNFKCNFFKIAVKF
jgi:hypothetical protein